MTIHVRNIRKLHFYCAQLLNFTKSPKQARYCQWALKYAIAIQGRSPTLYRFIREHNLLTLPCRNTIISYTGTSKGSVGVTNVNLARLKMIVNDLKDQEKKVSLEIDEMACKSLLLWIQPRQQFVGEVDFGNVPMNEDYYHLSNEECEDECEEEIYDVEDELEEKIGHGRDVDGGKISESAAFCHDDVSVNHGGPPVLANSILNFLVTGLTKRFSALVGCWPVARLTGRQLFCLTIHVIRIHEEIGFKVVRVVGDNAKVNVKLFQLLRRATDAEEFQWYNYHDICNLSQHYRQREASKKPFSDNYDERMQELDEEIPELLKKWNKDKKSAMECFTKETLEAIIFTCRSTANCVKYLLNGGFQFVVTRRFTTDNIERFHGAIRNCCGNNDHLSVGQCLSTIERINRTQLAITSMSCNTSLVTEAVLKKGDAIILNERKTKCIKLRARDVLKNTETANINLLKSLNSSTILILSHNLTDLIFH
ncbi:hypothetical protein DAPPUDRAFT_103668 [Daphnia pulex]|uniref:Transposable element P transposase-like RNase H domain-containing protein n=1 Tax=Daphnia pulex TaxID=6669 RepID=E9GJU2_DAPPU|nr:hypothetical protein DAPPUDRAFT_103668 [Daphnia pulex]|eukprot:EFX80259.1 hypothetical protein DAPPUDRAFT_103668 [Daphnia pulex]